MTYTPTPAEFLTQTEPDEDDVEPTATPDPLTSIAESLRLLTALASRETGDQADERLVRDLTASDAQIAKLQAENATLDEIYDDLATTNEVLVGQIDEVRALIKPSTSKLANSIRAVLDGPTTEPAAVDRDLDRPWPADDAPVEEWRACARSVSGLPNGVEVDSMNRSQIRTLLGIPQPV